MKQPEPLLLISIIIPVYNRENELEQTLQSIESQIYRPIELILVDNDSQDQSLAICKKFQDRNSNLFFHVKVLHEPKKGANAARNAGFMAATGNYALFFDSDDIMYPECISTIVGHLKNECLPDAIAYNFKIWQPNGKSSNRPHFHSIDPADQLIETLISTHNICIKKSVMDKIGNWDEELQRWQDLEFGFRILQQLKNLVWMSGKPIYEVISHENSISGNNYSIDHEKMYAALMKIRLTIESQQDGYNKSRQMRALGYKINTIATQCKKERNRILGKKYHKNALTMLPDSRKWIAVPFLKLQYLYEGNGGRGLWRIARIVL